MLFKNLPRATCTTGCGGLAYEADIAQLAERDYAMVEAPGSNPGIRSNRLIAGVLWHYGRARAPESAGAARMCAAGSPASCSETALSGVHRITLAPEHNRHEIPARALALPAAGAKDRSPRRAHASRVEIGRNDRAAPEPVTGNINTAPLTQ